MNRLRAFGQLVLARMREFWREPIAIFWVYGFPLILACILTLAFSRSTVEKPTMDVAIDPAAPAERAAELRNQLVKTLEADGIDVRFNDPAEADRRFKRTLTSLVITVVARPNEDYAINPDESRADTVNAKYRVEAALIRSKHPGTAGIRENPPPTPGGRYIDFLFPGLIGINLMGGGLFGIGFVLVETRARKLFKRLMATPMHRGDYLLAMLVSRLVFLAPEMISLVVIARPLFGVPMFGSWLLLVVVIFVGALTFAGLGLLIGCRTEKTETASGLLNLVMLPQYLLSGVFFSAKNFPDFAQPLIQALPLTQLNNALRAVFRGEGLNEVALPLLVMSAWALASFVLALHWFKWS